MVRGLMQIESLNEENAWDAANFCLRKAEQFYYYPTMTDSQK